MTQNKDIWVFGDYRNYFQNRVTLQIIAKATQLAAVTGGCVCAVVFGHNTKEYVSEYIAHGAQKVYLIDDPKLENIAVQAIEKIDKESHISGLTDRIKIFLEDLTGNKIENTREKVDDEIKAVNFEDSQENLSFEDHQKED